MTGQLGASLRLPLRFWLEVGLLDNAHMLESNRRMQAVIEGRGYDLVYREFCGGHDFALWRGTLAQALATMLPLRSA